MNAFEIPAGYFTLNAKSDVDWHRFIKVGSTGEAEYATAGTDPIIGVSYSEAKATQPLSIVGRGIAMVEASDTITAGDFVNPTTDGKAAKSDSASFYVALTGGNAGDLITVKM